MKKIILFVLVITLVLFSACTQLLDALLEEEKTQETSIDLKTAVPDNSTDESSESYADGPHLPSIDYANLDLFDDGYQIVYFDHAPDGDTAIFVVGDSYLKTRFLGVDTKEMTTDSGIPEPWAQQGKDFTNYMLENADEIILELDDNSDVFDDYDRLLAWIWVDGKLLNYMLAETGYADVKYLYDDYKYNDYLLDAEYAAQQANSGIWGEDEPYFNPNEYDISDIETNDETTIKSARAMQEGSIVKISGVITSKIGNNVFMQDETAGIYVYIGSKSYAALKVGNEISIEGTLSDYNGFLELTDIKESDIRILSSGHQISPQIISLSQVGESTESLLISLQDAKITFIDYQSGESGYTIFIEQNGTVGEVRIDKYLQSFPSVDTLIAGSYIDIVGNVSQHYDSYQIMIEKAQDITIK